MTAAELASFRTLLQSQAQPPPDRGLFARMRARLTVVERTEPPAAAELPRVPLAPPRLVTASWEEPEIPVADPPPSTPPVFGRRETVVERRIEPTVLAAAPVAVGEPAPDRVAVRVRRMVEVEEAHGTPDHLVSERPAGSAAPGTIAGWSRSRPPRAQQRILQRLEAVFTAERQGLEARIAADASAG